MSNNTKKRIRRSSSEIYPLVSAWASSGQNQQDFCQHHDIDILDCCSPTKFHDDLCKKALNRGLAVMCEKPLTGKVSLSRKLFSLAEELQAAFGMNFNFRFVPAIQEAKRRITSGNLGQLKSFRVEYHRSSNISRWKQGNWRDRSMERGALMDLGPHAIDMVHFLFGPILSLAAHVQYYDLKAGVSLPDDIAKLDITLKDNVRGYIEVSKITPGAANDLQIFAYGTEGSIRFSMENPNILEVFTGGEKWQSHQRIRVIASGGELEPHVIPPETPSSVLHWHAASIASFLKAVVKKHPPYPSIKDGLGVDIVIETALQSIAKGSQRISIPNWAEL